MALKFGLSNTFMGPQQAAKFGESFGESIGGLGLALGDAWKAYQEDQSLQQEVDDFTSDDEWSTGTRASDMEIQAMEDKWLSENPDWAKEGGEFKLYEDTQASKDLDAWAIGPEEGFYPARELEQNRQAAGLNYDDTQRQNEINALLAEGGPKSNEITREEGPSLIDYTLDRKSLKKVHIPEEGRSQQDVDQFIAEHGQEAYDELVRKESIEAERNLRIADPGMSSDARFQLNKNASESFAGNATNVLNDMQLTDWSAVQNPINYNPETEYNFQQGLKPNILGTALNNLGR